MACSWLLLGSLAYIGAIALKVTPVGKVLEMMNEMMAKAKQERQDEQVNFSAFSQFCENTDREKSRQIEDATEEIETLSADMEKAEADAAAAAKKFQEMEAKISGWTQERENATLIRKKENEDFLLSHKDYSESIDALDRAIQVMKKQSYDRKQAEALIQIVSNIKKASHSDKMALVALLQEEPDYLSRSAPEANAYEFQSGGVVGMLEKLQDKFGNELRELEKAEANSRHAYEMMAQDLSNSIESAETVADKAKKRQAKRESDHGQMKTEWTDATVRKNEDTKYLSDLRSECATKSQEFENRQKLRAEEIAAVQEAIDIIGSSAVSGNAETYLPALAQKGMSLLQIRKSSTPLQKSVAAYLQRKAHDYGSTVLLQAAESASEDPFVKVRKMIETLIERLQATAAEEAEHNAFCQKELKANKIVREDKQEETDTLRSRKEELEASIAKLKEKIAELSADLTDLAARVSEATTNRSDENKKNTQTIADSKESQAAVAQALQILKEFYAGAGKATSLVQSNQTPSEDAPVTWDKAYTGMQSESGGVVGMLEVIQSDFARLEADTTASEAEAADMFAKFKQDSEVSKATMTTERNNKEQLEVRTTAELHRTIKDLEGTQAELDAANKYYEKLKPTCVNPGVSYEERVAQREAEIASLKEALEILSASTE